MNKTNDNVTTDSENLSMDPADEIIGNAPEPSISSDETVRSIDATVSNAGGETFDPEIHATDASGNPLKTASGKYRKKPGRKKGVDYSAENRSTTPKAPNEIAGDIARNNSRHAAAIAAVETVQVIGRIIGGEEWAYIKNDQFGIDERASGIAAFERYFEAKNIDDLPPGIALSIWGVAYCAPRFAAPKTKNRLGLAVAWFKSKLSRNKHNGARTDIRNDRKRENNTSEDAGK